MPVYTLGHHEPAKSIDALVGAGDVIGQTFALPVSRSGLGSKLTWTMIFAGVVTACEYQLLGALNNVDAEYALLDSSTAVTGEMKHVEVVNIKFVRIRQVSRTGGTSATGTIMLA